MRTRAFVWLVAVLAVSGPLAAQEIEDTQVFPAAAHIAGAPPSLWVSDVAVTNLNDHSTVIGFQFLPENEAHTVFDLAFADRVTLAARETRLFQDVVADLLGYSEDVKGVLIVTCANGMLPGAGNPENTRILATMRTYDASSPVGTYGQTIPSLIDMVLNETGAPSYVTGARNDGTFRSNLGIVAISLTSIEIHYRVRRANGTVAVVGSKTMKPLSTWQTSFSSLGVGTVVGPLTVELWLDPADVPGNPCADFANGFLAYVSKVDGNSQDGEFMYAAPSDFPFCPGD